MSRTFWIGAAAAVVTMSAMVGAQSGGAMMASADKSYTGCIMKDAKSGEYSLTHAMAAAAAAAPTDGHMNDTAKAMKKGAAADMSMPVTSKDVDLSKHVGHTVTVTGSGSAPMAMGKNAMAMKMDPFTVKSLAMVSSSCTESK